MGHHIRFSALLLSIIALLGLVLSLVSTQRSGAGAQTIREKPNASLPRIKSEKERAFEQELEELGASLPGEVGIAVVDAQTGYSYDFNGEEILPQQSVSKLWVTMAALDAVDRGKLDLSERVTIRREDLTVFYQPIREIVRARGSVTETYADLMKRAITQSDNTANDLLLRRVGGPELVQKYLDARGIENVRFGTDERSKQSAIAGLEWKQAYSAGASFYDAREAVPIGQRRLAFERYLADPVDGASPIGIAKALAMLKRGELLSPESTALLLDLLGQTKSGPNRLKAGVPPQWRFGHKTGTGQYLEGEQSGYNDVGLLTAPDGRTFAIATMIGRTRASTPARMEMMQEVVRATVRFHEARTFLFPGAEKAP